MIFGMQLTSYKKFDEIVAKIETFRDEQKKDNRSYKVFMGENRDREIEHIYQSDIAEGKTKTRESKDAYVSILWKLLSQLIVRKNGMMLLKIKH